jgi:hypothetical protein
LAPQMTSVVEKVTCETIEARAEPVDWRCLHAAIYAQLAQSGLLARVGPEAEAPSPADYVAELIQTVLERPTFRRLSGGERGQELWWLAQPAGGPAPLCDRVEIAAHQVLQEGVTLTEAEFDRALCAHFPGPLTPEDPLVTACLRSYGRQISPGRWQLRAEDQPAERQAERQEIIEHLLALGRRLGYGSRPRVPFDAAWFEGKRLRAVFAVHWQAAVSEALALDAQQQGISPYLVIPGSRAALVSYKLAHNPLWQEAVDEAGWRFIKYRHVRQLLAQPEIDEYVLRTVVGLDPIVEQESAQLPLF